MNEFEKQWLTKLKLGLQKIDRLDLYDEAVAMPLNIVDWSDQLMKILSRELTETEIVDVMCGCACLAPKEYLKILRAEYKKTANLEQIHRLLQIYFEQSIRKMKNLNDEQMQYIIDNDMGMAGTLKGKVITAVKIPKDFHAYFQTNDRNEKRYLYCHCPRIREALKSNDKAVDKNYCYCGAGFYRDIWEYILQRKVKVVLVESLFQGNEQCKIEIHI